LSTNEAYPILTDKIGQAHSVYDTFTSDKGKDTTPRSNCSGLWLRKQNLSFGNYFLIKNMCHKEPNL